MTNRLKERALLASFSFASFCQAHGLNAGSHVPFYHGGALCATPACLLKKPKE